MTATAITKTTIALVVLIIPYLPYTTAQTCVDVPNWTDAEGDGCDFYAALSDDDEYMGEPLCEVYGDCCTNDGHTAQTACCACGGGSTFLETCQSDADFQDCDGNTCEWYEQEIGVDGVDDYYDDVMDTRCWLFADDATCADPVTGKTANDACCVCGGGSTTTTANTSAPSSAPTVTPPTVTTSAPVTSAPVTSAPVTAAPVTAAPVTAAPTKSPGDN
eukprot:CAMPEP_0116027048 /NCGR_PEP_ID=MMETSP0321-20121206/14349_1 /TAXON_ID=163516 /ORGANISM="Leptocylindrus danicus var. danicus, Strain B650" /LENGTH=217 /DNA_ID=CAMNT_0003500233 /DNA_START=18 /DNA_END=668 /DNA_ORIENTATION=+